MHVLFSSWSRIEFLEIGLIVVLRYSFMIKLSYKTKRTYHYLSFIFSLSYIVNAILIKIIQFENSILELIGLSNYPFIPISMF